MLFFVHQTIYLLACTCIRLFICWLLLVSDYYLLASTFLFICYFLLAVIYLISHSLRVRGCARGHADIRGQRVRVLFYARSGLRARVLACGCGFIKPISARILPVAILNNDSYSDTKGNPGTQDSLVVKLEVVLLDNIIAMILGMRK